MGKPAMDIVIFIIACIGNVGLVIWLQGVVQRAMPAPRAPQADWADLRANGYARRVSGGGASE